ncbi:MAG: acyl-CoA/acyl-ACP dehydrogenase [Burkholderiaceae bacterium]|nr:acyl-CoA/acyl-ACP dehydrogenase [Burkholderiaceae bacterium]
MVSSPVASTALVSAISDHVKTALAPISSAIDTEGLYPADYLRELGRLGGFNAAIPTEYGGQGLDLATQIDINTAIAAECGSTSFLAWCQASCAWYFLHTANQGLRERYLQQVASGALLAGTGMSNAIKHLAGIEKIHLSATRDGDDYVINGSLPWVSNVGDGHLVIVAVAVEGEGYAMLPVLCATDGLTMHNCPEFAGLEGTQTLNLRFKNVRVPTNDALAHPAEFKHYISRIKPGFILGQTGMAFGITASSLKTLRESNASSSHTNIFLDDQEGELAAELDTLKAQTAALARQTHTGQPAMLDVLKARAQASELVLKAANSAVLHAGAKGYLMRHPAQRRLREAVFVAIVTPALKHLRKEIHDLELAAQQLLTTPHASTPATIQAA